MDGKEYDYKFGKSFSIKPGATIKVSAIHPNCLHSYLQFTILYSLTARVKIFIQVYLLYVQLVILSLLPGVGCSG